MIKKKQQQKKTNKQTNIESYGNHWYSFTRGKKKNISTSMKNILEV